MCRRIEEPDIAGRSAVVLKDISTTDGSPLEAVEVPCEAGANVRTVAIIVDRATGTRKCIEAAGLSHYTTLGLVDLGLERASDDARRRLGWPPRLPPTCPRGNTYPWRSQQTLCRARRKTDRSMSIRSASAPDPAVVRFGPPTPIMTTGCSSTVTDAMSSITIATRPSRPSTPT